MSKNRENPAREELHSANMNAQLSAAWEQNEAYIKNKSILNPPEIRFYDFLFLKKENDNSPFFALLNNLPEWAAIAKKSQSKAYLVTDKTTIGILKSQKLPPESGMTGSYFDYLNKGGIEFTTIKKLIKNLPRDNAEWKNLHGRIKRLVDKGTLHPVAFRDLARPIVMMGSVKDHSETITVQKELDNIVSSKLANAFKGPEKLLPPFSIQGSIHAINIHTNDPQGRTLLIQSKTAHGKDSPIEREELKQKFSDYDVTGSHEVCVAKGKFIYTGYALENALKEIEKLEKDGSGEPWRNTNALALSFEKLAHLAYGPSNHKTSSVIDPKALGIIGSFYIKTWVPKIGGLVGQFVPPLAAKFQIDSIINPDEEIPPLSWNRVQSLNPKTKPLVAKTPSFDLAFWRQFIKNAAILMVYYALPPLSSAPAISAGNRSSVAPYLNQSSDQLLKKPLPATLESSKPQENILLKRVEEEGKDLKTIQGENQPNPIIANSRYNQLGTVYNERGNNTK
jgi:hypothetical protein